MAGADGKNSTIDEKTAERGMCTSLRKFSESNSLKDSPRTALVLNGSPRRFIVFNVFTLEFDACRKLLLPVAPPIHESDRGIHVGPGVHGNLDNLEQASPLPSILCKFDLQKEQMIHMPDRRGSAKAFVVSSSSRENVARQSRKKSKRCKSVKNCSTTCLQNGVLSNISSCLICDGSNLVIHSAVTNGNLTVGKPMRRNLKKTKKKGDKRLSHWKGFVGSGNVREESVCDVSVCESSSINNPSSPEEISEFVLSEKPTSNSLAVKVFSMENNDSDDHSIDAVKPSAATVKCIPSTGEMDVFEQTAAFSDDFAREDLGCSQTGIDECSANRSNYSSAEQTSERAISSSSGSTYIGDLSDISSYSSSSRNNALILDTVLDSGNGDNTACSGADVETQLCIDKGSLSSYAEGVMVCNSQQDIAPQCMTPSSCKTNRKKPNDFQICDPCSSEDPVLTYNIDDRTRCSSEACSSSTSIAFSPVKRGRNSRKTSGNFNVLHKFGNANTYARTRKEVNHSVWQRVQKNSGEESIYEHKDPVSFSLQHDRDGQVTESRLEDDASFWMGQSGNGELLAGDSVSMRMMKNAVDMNKHLSKPSGKVVNKIPEKFKMKSILVPKQGLSHLLRKGSQNGMNDLAQPVKNSKTYAVGSQRSDVSPTKKANSFPSKPWVKEKAHADEMIPTVNISDMVHNIGSYAAQNDINLLAKTLDSLDMKRTLEANCDVTGAKFDEDMRHAFCHIADKKSAGRKPENGGLHAEHSKQDNNSLPVLHKWVPVGKRDSGRSKLKSVSSESVDCFSPELDGVTDGSRCSPHYISKGHVSSNCHFTQEAGDQSTFNFETDLDKINLVVKEAYKLQIASETFQLANGSPLAEFERLLYSASPVVGQMYSILGCKSCSPDQRADDTLCWHQIPNISLRNLWQWYEKPGNYGLEVKVEDYLNAKRLGNDKFDFRAYFVPYLSAVQLFGRSAGCTCSDSCFSDDKINKGHEADNMSKNSSQLSNLPIFSLLVPRPGPPGKEAVLQRLDSSSSSYSKDKPCNYSVCKKCLMAQELLFEYFESDQPQLRRPLLEKIKELVKGSSFSNSQTFGDPLKLECLNLHDLHPASWFSVAWYPIYRIPDGNFRAAFLTYHSFGHFTHRSALLKSADGVSHIVSPVVGLQSYNAKGECWFRQRDSQTMAVQTAGLSTLTPSEILKERLRTLERTASVMSRASVPKGGQTSVNRQPDFEFFLSRRS